MSLRLSRLGHTALVNRADDLQALADRCRWVAGMVNVPEEEVIALYAELEAIRKSFLLPLVENER